MRAKTPIPDSIAVVFGNIHLLSNRWLVPTVLQIKSLRILQSLKVVSDRILFLFLSRRLLLLIVESYVAFHFHFKIICEPVELWLVQICEEEEEDVILKVATTVALLADTRLLVVDLCLLALLRYY